MKEGGALPGLMSKSVFGYLSWLNTGGNTNAYECGIDELIVEILDAWQMCDYIWNVLVAGADRVAAHIQRFQIWKSS